MDDLHLTPRWMLTSDIDQVVELDNHCCSSYTSDLFMDQPIRHYLRVKNVVAMVLEGNHNQGIIAWMLYELHRHEYEILRFAVDPLARRCGYGRLLMQTMRNKIHNQNVRDRCYMTVPDEMLSMHLFLKSEGFEAKAVVHHDHKQYDSYLMVLDCKEGKA